MSLPPWEYTPADAAALKLLHSVEESPSYDTAWNELSPAQVDSIHTLVENHPELKSTEKTARSSSAVGDYDRLSDYPSLPSTPSKLTASAFQQLQKERYREDLGHYSSLPDTPRGLSAHTYEELHQRYRDSMSQRVRTEARPATTKAASDIPSWMKPSEPTQPFDEEAQLANDMSLLSDETEQMLGHIHNSLLETIEWEKQVRINTFRLIAMRAQQQQQQQLETAGNETAGNGAAGNGRKNKQRRNHNKKKGKGKGRSGGDGMQ
ncbi:hypothetical protein QQX98_010517 [Neonectria punicea]|uniref:Uncharacterized protein n=1 Tax=Neonectria punicea TaxID=979145 RepID=A0ABR1GPL9_9HYPO